MQAIPETADERKRTRKKTGAPADASEAPFPLLPAFLRPCLAFIECFSMVVLSIWFQAARFGFCVLCCLVRDCDWW